MQEDTSSNIVCEHYQSGLLCACVRRYYTVCDDSGSYIDISSTWLVGPTGCMGPTGPIGPTGPTGPVIMAPMIPFFPNNKTFLSIYTTMEQQVEQNAAVIFDSSSAIMGDCLFETNNPDIWITTPGFYQIYTNIYHLEACQFALYKNGVIVENGTTGSLSGSSQNTNNFIIQVLDTDIMDNGCNLQLINNTAYLPYVTIIGSSSSGNAMPQVSASLTIIKIC